MNCSLTSMNTRRGVACNLRATGEFKEALPSIELSVHIISHLKDGTTGDLQIDDDMCNWVQPVQGGVAQCPPKQGKATISASIDLPRWVEDVS